MPGIIHHLGYCVRSQHIISSRLSKIPESQSLPRSPQGCVFIKRCTLPTQQPDDISRLTCRAHLCVQPCTLLLRTSELPARIRSAIHPAWSPASDRCQIPAALEEGVRNLVRKKSCRNTCPWRKLLPEPASVAGGCPAAWLQCASQAGGLRPPCGSCRCPESGCVTFLVSRLCLGSSAQPRFPDHYPG